ncbi:MAG: outer membrane beta-barrel protein [Pseudomonadota bacterium]
MRVKARASVTLLFAVLVPTVHLGDVQADPIENWVWYAELGFGGPIPKSYDVVVGNGVGPGDYEPDPGFGMAVAFGAYVTPRWRAELTLAFATAGDGELTGTAAGVQPHFGDVYVYSPMVNAFYEFDRFDGTKITPWIGFGAGAQIYDYQGLGPVAGPYIVNDTAAAPFGALHFGLDYELTPRIDVLAKYSLVVVGDHDVVGTGQTAVAVDGGVENTIFAGFRYRLSGE